MTGPRSRRLLLAATLTGAGVVAAGSIPAAAAWTPPQPVYQAGDYAHGDTFSILPPGENGLVNAAELAQFEATGARPAGSQDQLGKYASLLYGASSLTDAQLSNYYDEESFGIQAGQVTRTETPSSTVPVVIYRDQHQVPHIYGADLQSLSFGAGYAAAEDRLFEMDVLRHYGAGTLSSFLGPSCADEQMDHDELLLTGYSQSQKEQQLDHLAALDGIYGPRFEQAVGSYVAGINAYITASQTNPSMVPADYGAVGAPPQPWQPTDIIDIASLVGGIFGKGGGIEVQNAALLQYLQRQLGATAAHSVFTDFKEQNDADAPTTITGTSFPYEIPGTVDPATTAMPDDAAAPLTGGPTDTTPDCSLTPPNPTALSVVAGLLSFPTSMSNALLIDAQHSANGHPIAVFGPQVGYFAPQILMEEDLHAPGIAAEGAAFPGTNLVVELGRGPDFAWSATSAGSDIVDQRLELICDPNGGTPQPNGTYYLYNGQCRPMRHNTFTEICYPKPGGPGGPTVITHDIYQTVHGVIQGWTTSGGRPVAVVNQRSTWGHELDSGVGFARWMQTSRTHDAASWMQGAAMIQYTFNWFYVDDRDIAYYQSGLDPVRPSNVDPNLPSWGTGNAEWTGYLSFAAHPHEIGSPTGYITSWNNKPAPQFSAADDEYGYGPVHRVLSLNEAIAQQFALTGNRMTRASLVQAMESAAVVDRSGRSVLTELLPYLASRTEPAGVQQMIAALQQWLADGAGRHKPNSAATQYSDASAVATMDELYPRLARAFFDGLFAAGGVTSFDGISDGYTAFPMLFTDTPDGYGSHHGSAYLGGWEGYVVKALRQLRGESLAQPFSASTWTHVCGSGAAACGGAIDAALQSTYAAMVAANGGSSQVSAWTQNTATQTQSTTLPVYDSIHFQAIGIVGQPNIDWQNRPTFQQVAMFPAHRPRSGAMVTSGGGAVPAAALLLGGPAAVLPRRRTGR